VTTERTSQPGNSTSLQIRRTHWKLHTKHENLRVLIRSLVCRGGVTKNHVTGTDQANLPNPAILPLLLASPLQHDFAPPKKTSHALETRTPSLQSQSRRLVLARARSTAAPLSRLQLLIAAYFPSPNDTNPSSDPKTLFRTNGAQAQSTYRVRISAKRPTALRPVFYLISCRRKGPMRGGIFLRGKGGVDR
jgi:hypothetical protein